MDSILRGVGTTSTAKDEIFSLFNDRDIFDTPKPTKLIKELLRVSTRESSIVLDFFAGSGTMGQATIELNNDGGNRKFILVTNNEITDKAPNGIAYDITTKRLKRVMTGECYDGAKDFKWLESNSPSKVTQQIFYLPILREDVWQITTFKSGVERTLTLDQFRAFVNTL